MCFTDIFPLLVAFPTSGGLHQRQELEELHNQIVAALDKLVSAVSLGTQKIEKTKKGMGITESHQVKAPP